MLSTGTIPESFNSIYKALTSVVPNHSLGIPLSLFAGFATTSLFFFTLRDVCFGGRGVTKSATWETTSDSGPKSSSKIVPGPLTTQIPTLSSREIFALPYPPDIFPGARDIPSPYGSTRAYEFGPPIGPMVLLIHGISTPCISFHSLATTLAFTYGYRVLLFDLFGRGYSDGVADLPHDERLYTAQILLVLTSSMLSWVRSGFSIIGFSMGGGIAVDFAVAFPDMVTNVILLAPGGLIREQRFGWKGRVMRKWWFPDALWGWILRRRVNRAYKGALSPPPSSSSSPLQASDLALDDKEDENQGQVDSELTTAIPSSSLAKISFDDTPISPSLPYITVGEVMRWQTQRHQGYANAFASSIIYASISGREETWRRLWGSRGGKIIRDENRLRIREKILVVVGEWDDVVVAEELKEDLVRLTDNIDAKDDRHWNFDERVIWEVVKGAGHEFPITKGEEVAGLVAKFIGV
ncbi:hypothetical protein DSL72_003038 [Monilinia vaccinii-corymbosi]|uniref:AB hydrolase-1 domain-containing protein n=1 Tax=Monilinia vaccinii-corymbosi TaxID=61207 RepID=A0A8A3NWY9_9HELO|nr:hypothetical protein DSL72_003038 [Monilinia vaccinii-corymbosi]